MANWADVEFRESANYPRSPDVLSFAADALLLCDFLASLACGAFAHAIWPGGGTNAGTATFLPEIVIGSLTLALALRSASMLPREPSRVSSSAIKEPKRRYSGVVLACIAVALVLQIGHGQPQFWVAIWFGQFAVYIGAVRLGLRIFLRRQEQFSATREAPAIVGLSAARKQLAERVVSKAAAVCLPATPAAQADVLPHDDLAKLPAHVFANGLDGVVLAFEAEQSTDICALVEQSTALPPKVAGDDACAWSKPDAANLCLLPGVPLTVVTSRSLNRRDLLVKAAIDKILAVILIGLLLPLMAAIAVVIATTSKGPVIFRQTRQGWCGRRFTLLKFRTMKDVSHLGDKYTQTKRRDPRCTVVGRILRRTSLDELPQLWNVIRGDMSLVGPRPHADMLEEDDRAGREIVTEYAQRHRVKPGITGWAQIHGARGPTTTVEQLRRRVAYDIHYIEHWSLWLDLQIIARTPFCLMGKNVF